MPTSSPSLRKEVVSEDRKDMGCMTGILHIFDRRPSFSGRHCGCRWTATRNGLFSCHPQTDQMQVLFWICKGNETCKSWRTKKITCCFFFPCWPGQIVTTASGRVYRELRCNPAYDMVHAPPSSQVYSWPTFSSISFKASAKQVRCFLSVTFHSGGHFCSQWTVSQGNPQWTIPISQGQPWTMQEIEVVGKLVTMGENL